MSRETNTADLITRYLIVAAGLLGILMVVAASYEIAINVGDSRADTGLEIVKWTGPALGTTTIVLIYWEVLNMILKKLYQDQARKEARQEVNLEWEEWNRRRERAQIEGKDFDEPNPAEKRRQGISRG
ncbi:MAG: hypothetical protein F4X65_15675 [Chloroflexi bacterium]|nr:hypothetical protein [Chloroflexota bacterium]